MIWHIFKKDWKLMWPMAVAVASIHLMHRFVLYEMGHFGRPSLASLLDLLLMCGYLGSAFLIIAAVHQDAIPGVRQDWLVRPLRRRDLLLEKILFVVLLVQGPIIAADLLEPLLFGFPFHQSLAASLSRAVNLLPFFCLAMLAFASLTRNLTEAIVAGAAVFLGGFLLILIAQDFAPGGHPQLWVQWSGLVWIEQSARISISLFIAIAVLSLQYFRKKTLPSRWIFSVGVLAWVLTFFTPWKPAFAIQKWMSSRPGAARPVAVAFEPGLGKGNPPLSLTTADRPVRSDEDGMLVSLPLRVTGLPDDSVLNADHYAMRIIGKDGKPLNAGEGDNFVIYQDGPAKRNVEAHQSIRVPANVYERVKSEPVQLEIDYSLTLMRLTGAYALSTIDGDQRTSEAGWCQTRVNEERTAVQLRCVLPGNGPSCSTVFLENPSTGLRNPPRSRCAPNYWPYVGGFMDSMSRFGATIPYMDPTGLAHYPVDGSQLQDARMIVRVYRPEDHFTRRLAVSSARLAEWVVR